MRVDFKLRKVFKYSRLEEKMILNILEAEGYKPEISEDRTHAFIECGEEKVNYIKKKINDLQDNLRKRNPGKVFDIYAEVMKKS